MYRNQQVSPSSWAIDTNYVSQSTIAGIEDSPCKTCEHRGTLPAKECIERKDCPLNPPRPKIHSYVRPEGTGKSKPRAKIHRHQCPMEGCQLQTTRVVCWRHKVTYERRIARGVPEAELYKEGHIREGRVTELKRCALPGCKKMVKLRKKDGKVSYGKRKFCSLSCGAKWGNILRKERAK